jgi:hypothetical protein
MKKKSKVINKTKLFRSLQREIKSGININSPDIKNHLDRAVSDLSPYFENTDVLPLCLGVGGLRYEYSFLQSSLTKSWIEKTLRDILAEFRLARDSNAVLCFQVWGKYTKAIDNAIRNTAVTALLQQNLGKLSSELLTKSVLRDVGDILEGSLQPIVRLRLDMLEIAGKRATGAKPVEAMTFGQVVEELILISTDGAIYRIDPHGITVSQLRNIANHNSYIVEKDIVTCTYGKGNPPHSVSFPATDLINLGLYINDLYFIHKIAYEFFSVDNLTDISSYFSDIEVTEHTTDGTLVYGLVTSGFNIVKAGYKSGVWSLGLIDEYNREEVKAKIMLQNAFITYLLHVGSVEVYALIKNRSKTYKVSFQARTQGSKDTNELSSNEKSIMLDEYLQGKPDDSK